MGSWHLNNVLTMGNIIVLEPMPVSIGSILVPILVLVSHRVHFHLAPLCLKQLH